METDAQQHSNIFKLLYFHFEMNPFYFINGQKKAQYVDSLWILLGFIISTFGVLLYLSKTALSVYILLVDFLQLKHMGLFIILNNLNTFWRFES